MISSEIADKLPGYVPFVLLASRHASVAAAFLAAAWLGSVNAMLKAVHRNKPIVYFLLIFISLLHRKPNLLVFDYKNIYAG